jgi:cell shape-determining protein MreC
VPIDAGDIQSLLQAIERKDARIAELERENTRLRESVKRSVQVMLQANRETEAAVHISELEAENARLREAATAFLNVADRKTREADDLRAALDEGEK